MKTKILWLLFLFVQITFAQEIIVSGIVSDETSPLPGVSIFIKGSVTGTETDLDGKYQLKVKQNDVLVFSFVGKKTIEKTVSGSNKINITLVNDENLLQEVVITSLGKAKKKKSLGFAQASVTGEDLVKTNEVDINNSIAGKVSGVQAIGNSGATFDNAGIRLRGNSNVLYIVDGVRVQSPADINTADIDDISILKGGAATSLYGTDASGGVVLITSKKAKNGTEINVQFSTEVGSVTNMLEYQNEYGGGYSQDFIAMSNGQLRPD